MEYKTDVRIRRQLIDFFSHKTIFKPNVPGSNSKVHMQLGDAALTKGDDSPGHAGMRVASNMITDGGEFIRTPLKWIKDMQANWLIYIVCAAIICLSILYLYCMIRKRLHKKQNLQSGFSSQLADLALVMANNQQHHSMSKDLNAKKETNSDVTPDHPSTRY